MTTEQHVPVEQLAAYAAGDLDATAALEVEAHVLLCAGCRSDVEAVQRVAADLAAVPAVPMPADIASRIDAALAAEAEAPGGPAGDVLPLVPKKRRPSFAGFAAVAAGVALVAALGVPLLSNGGGADRTATEAGGDREPVVTTRRLESGLEYDAAAPEKALAEALGGARRDAVFARSGAASPQSGDDATADASDSPEAAAQAPAALRLKVEQLDPLRSDAARLAACVTALAESQPEGVGRTPLLVDFGTFEQRPALIVVFPTVRQGEVRADRVDFWAVGPSCGVTPGDDDVLHFARLVRPAGL